MGLKRDIDGIAEAREALPQSNQRGIETAFSLRPGPPVSRPQSNQRGIETWIALGEAIGLETSLNRTSVGLKQPTPTWTPIWRPGPQSNQRGIETVLPRPFRVTAGEGPQSNQRGIETWIRQGLIRVIRPASIEPAWD